MPQRALYWLIAVSLVTHSLSVTIGMSGAHAHGLWTISCAGKPMLLPLPGDTSDSSPTSHCLYCNGDTPETLAAKGTSLPLHQLSNAQPQIATTTTRFCNDCNTCHPARAPPVIH